MLTQARLKECLRYDPETGDFVWLVATKGYHAGRVAGGFRPDGYQRICIDGRYYYGHRLAHLYMTGEWPPHIVDHINGDPRNNRWANLRCATNSENLRNKGASSGLKGVSRCRGRWRATIQLNGKQRHLGVFDTPEAAHDAYAAASREMHGEFGRAA